jgi:short-subunit dehydrogenase
MLAETLRKHAIVVALLCPGHTKTRMGLETNASIEVEESVAGMRNIIDRLTMSDTGSFTRYNGERIAW